MDTGHRKPRILFVEDDQVLSDIYSERFKAEGYTVLESFDGDAALAMYKEFHPDLVICDLMMPHVTGFEVIEQLRADPDAAGLRIVVMSALGQEENIQRAMQLGADDYIVKSRAELDEIVERVAKLLPAEPIAVGS